jgi:apolipoprotein N-acyltransferase
MKAVFNSPLALSIITGFLLGMAWIVSGTTESCLLGWFAALGIVLTLRESRRRLWPLYLAGVISHSIAFSWLTQTITDFGGFPLIVGLGIFSLFVATAAFQFGFVALLFRMLPDFLDKYYLRSALAWIAGETLFIRIFPWNLGHTQLSFTSIIQAADLGGVLLISFLLIIFAEGIIESFQNKRRPLLVGALFLVVIVYGVLQKNRFLKAEGKEQAIAVIQGNLSIVEKRNIRYFDANVQRYEALSKPLVSESTLIIWPESVVQEFLPVNALHASDDPRFPLARPILFGGLSATRFGAERYNTAFGILANGTVLPPYHKRILMPFGEFIPFSDTFPALKALDPNIADFSAGDSARVFIYPMRSAAGVRYPLKVSALICYEDIAPSLARESVNDGAELLVNLTNDAWFGRSAAPYQHNTIAAFRAIENRRFLVRSTNTGLTAIVSPNGETTSSLPLFHEGTLLATVQLLRYNTFYTWCGDLPWYALALVTVLLAIRYRKLNRISKT